MLTREEEQEIGRLDKEIASLKLQDTNKEIERRKQELRDLESLIASSRKAEAAFDDAAVDDVNRLIAEVQSRRGEVERSGMSRFAFAGPACESGYKSAERARRFYSEALNLPPAEQEAKLQQGFGALRTSYEALVVFEMFNNVVRRFEERIGFDHLQGVRIDPQLIDEVVERMGMLSRHIEAHLHSDAFSTSKPTPRDLLREIEAFENIRNRQKQLKKS
jgi:hypothetical protein